MTALRVVLDTCSIWGSATRDWLLTLAMMGHFEVFWCHRILDALRRHLLPKRLEQLERKLIATGTEQDEASRQATALATTQMNHLLESMKQAFPTAMIPDDVWRPHLASCANDEEDRHVLACAIASNSSIIITENVKDFPAHAMTPHGITAMTLDTFLATLPTRDLLQGIDVVAKRNKRPPKIRMAVLDIMRARY